MTPFLDYSLGPVRQALWALFGAVGVLLIIGCANVSGLMLTRASFRRRDHAIRLALGATPAAIGRLWVAETAVLSAAGGCLGILGAHWMAKAMVAIAPQNLPRLTSVAIDVTVAAFTCAVVALTALLCGAGPLRHALASNPLDGLNATAAATATRNDQRSRSALVALEIGLAIALMIAAGLVVRSFVNLRQIRLGFAPSRVLTMTVNPRTTRPVNEWMAELLAARGGDARRRGRRRCLPAPAGARTDRPGDVGRSRRATRDRRMTERQNPALNYQVATAGYFTAMRIELKRGRLFTDDDHGRSPRVALVGESTARRLWPGTGSDRQTRADADLRTRPGRRARGGRSSASSPMSAIEASTTCGWTSTTRRRSLRWRPAI